ncbi:MAG: fluoride efflux transporter CrcB [Proteobacteria bacterium]|nr:fluoride efflux transporter CrcB [Pseudomonadota bacterium]
MLELLALALAGAMGTLARYGATALVNHWAGPDFPYGTLAVNAVGSLLLGFLSHALLHHPSVPPEWRVPLTTGFLGAFTTFSTFSVETVKLLDAGQPGAAAANIALNLVLGLALAGAGLALGRAWIPAA